MPKNRFPVTPAIRVLKVSRISYTLHSYKYEEKGGTKLAADELNVPDGHFKILHLWPPQNTPPRDSDFNHGGQIAT